jgi:hypothetical protein
MCVDPLQLLLVLGTWALAASAIWGERIKFLSGLGPYLEISLWDSQGELVTVPSANGTESGNRFYHLRVTNRHRWAPAQNVRVAIVSVTRPRADSTYVKQQLIDPIQLTWRYPQYHPLYPVVGSPQTCDLGHIEHGQSFELTPVFKPHELTYDVAPNQKMIVKVKAVADNAESDATYIEISWDGQWSDDTAKMALHLVLKNVKAPESDGQAKG